MVNFINMLLLTGGICPTAEDRQTQCLLYVYNGLLLSLAMLWLKKALTLIQAPHHLVVCLFADNK
ncbi:hypothetical protein M378DRAFT_11863 [Amanita muscaria Koide BX008]|uniref:Uncharacterized protein n=1 Tax=Amanita muscaria (strain Koide BX008) TaxID=946122 RepID=A0A0C2X4W8_AMAMK|nr:hypothetical protein M378DRAFT_11863 [Amanita muscaria Koide BX008]